MNIDLADIIQNGGPVGFALLFAWLWLRAEGKIGRLEDKLEAKGKELIEFYKEIIRKADGNA